MNTVRLILIIGFKLLFFFFLFLFIYWRAMSNLVYSWEEVALFSGRVGSGLRTGRWRPPLDGVYLKRMFDSDDDSGVNLWGLVYGYAYWVYS